MKDQRLKIVHRLFFYTQKNWGKAGFSCITGVYAAFFYLLLVVVCPNNAHAQTILKFPDHQETKVNPDSRLILTFPDKVVLHNKGMIRIYDAATNALVDMLDMGIAPGPKNTRTLWPYDSFTYSSIPDKVYTVKDPDTNSNHIYQKNYIGGNLETDAFHFYPVILRENSAIICPHNNKLTYNKTYYVEIDPEVFSLNGKPYSEINGKSAWVFSTRKNGPSLNSTIFTVSADGKGDFNTLQGAVDFIPAKAHSRRTILIKNGIYDEMVYFREKENISFIGEDRGKVVINYANNGVFNTKLMSPDPQLAKGIHNVRAVFAVDKSKGIHLVNLTLRSLGEQPAQAEALLILGTSHIVNRVNIEGSGDALQATGTIYVTDSKIQGFGDNVLGYGAVFFNHCDFVSTFGPHLWVRNTQENHGNVLVNCTLRTIGDVETTIARAPTSNGKAYPYVEAVLIDCKLEGVSPEGWGKVAEVADSVRYWEYNSTTLDGKPADVSKRSPVSKQLSKNDASLMDRYRNPAFVLGGWMPDVEADEKALKNWIPYVKK